MSFLSGYDSEVVGFESISMNKATETDCSTQTSEFSETGVGCQTTLSKDCGCSADPVELNAGEDILREYPPPGLNEFLRKVVPGVMEQLNQNEREVLYNSSDSDEEDTLPAKLYQEIQTCDGSLKGTGDHVINASVLSVSWSNAGNSFAVALGKPYHDEWCEHNGMIRIYTIKRSDNDKFVHNLDITEKNCINVVKYHPNVAGLLAYGTNSGEVVLCNLQNTNTGTFDQSSVVTSPGGHDSNRVTALKWADSQLTNTFLTMQVKMTGKRRVASDQVLISSGSDGTINVWQVNGNSKTFNTILCYKINGTQMAVDITCFDFLKSIPLRSTDEKYRDDVFVVGASCGRLYLCDLKNYQPIASSSMVDPVYEVLGAHHTCVLDVAFNNKKTGILISISTDAELRVYDVRQTAPIKVICMDYSPTCMTLLPHDPSLVLVGLSAAGGDVMKVVDLVTGKPAAVEGLNADGDKVTVTAVDVGSGGTCRVVAGTAASVVRVYDLPQPRRLRRRDPIDCIGFLD